MQVDKSYFEIQKNGITPFQSFLCYLGGSTFQTIGDNPITAYRQFIQQYAKDTAGKLVDPKVARQEANQIFMRSPVSASMSGLSSRMVGILLKRIPKFGTLFLYTSLSGKSGEPGFAAATFASIVSAPFINPVRMMEKQQRVSFRETGKEKYVKDILRESAEKKFKPLFRGTIPLMGHSLISAMLGLVGQPQLQKHIQCELGTKTKLGESASNLIASAAVTPFYVFFTNPLSRLEVIMQTTPINKKQIGFLEACKELSYDMAQNGMKGVFRGQGIGMVKGVLSLTLFHEGRLFLMKHAKESNKAYL
jgi:hypothetical protein